MMIVHYEVYVLEPRGWMLHARFPRNERDEAIAEAKELEKHAMKVRVVRETYHTDSNTFDEADVYMTGKAPVDKSRPAARPVPAPAAARGGSGRSASQPSGKPSAAEPAPSRPPPRKKVPEARAASQVVLRLAAILAAALVVAMLAVKITPDAIMTMWKWGVAVNVQPENYPGILFAVFILTFLMAAVPLAMRFLPRQAEVKVRHRPAPPPPAAAAAENDRSRELKRSLDRLARQALTEEMLAELGLGGPSGEPPAEPVPAAPSVAVPPPPAAEPPHQRAEPEPPEHAPAGPDPAAEPNPEPKPAEVPPPPLAAAEPPRSALMRFLDTALDVIRAIAIRLDNYNKFALHLYVAGGVDTLCETSRLDDGDRRQLTGTALETLGTAGEMADRFQDHLPEYLLEPRYMRVIQAGRSAMNDFLDGREREAHRGLEGVIREWGHPTEKKASIVTVMFTDMVGSTDLTQAKGDMAAQEVVRSHNGIVRSAIAQQEGREIKHTGDGIMASFPSASGAVEAAAQIQRGVEAHNQRHPELGMRLRIGLNAGEPIEEEDDLYGSTVQLAARVCAATDPDQILCTAVVKDLASGKGASFVPAGSRILKGFRDPVPLFEISWRSATG
ncbi:MAG: adenylate/guanylate cyclase domain-containing protein [Magnetospirillum sp.]|nr:adenylate/guanylate cyclase domain-containing protein [Magnetospirillum sp.]